MNEHMPSVFIGSSTEGLDVAREVELQLQRDAITTIWKDGVFGPDPDVVSGCRRCPIVQ
jgi:hypothetical protein